MRALFVAALIIIGCVSAPIQPLPTDHAASGYTYDGCLDPYQTLSWDIYGYGAGTSNHYGAVMIVIVINPALNGEFGGVGEKVVVGLDCDNETGIPIEPAKIVAYGWEIDGQIHGYMLDIARNRYICVDAAREGGI